MRDVDPFGAPGSPAAPATPPAATPPASAATSAPETAPEPKATTDVTAEPTGAPEAPAEPPEAETGGKRSRGFASGGKQVEVPAQAPPIPTWPGESTEEGYVPDENFDSTDLNNVNRAINQARARLFRVSGMMRAAQRAAADADLTYRRHLRRALVQVSGGSAEIRKAVAELQCEPYENDYVIAQQVAEEYKKRAMDVRDDLKALENLSHNVRAQMQTFER